MTPIICTPVGLRSAITLAAAIILLHAAFPSSSAQAQQRDIDVRTYEAQVRITPDTRSVEGTARITVRNPATAPLDRISLDLTAMTLSSVKARGQVASFDYDMEILAIDLAPALQPDDSVLIEIAYSGSPANEGGSQPWGGCHWGSTSYFMGVGFSAPSVSLMRYWLPSNDVPNDKATFDVTFTVPEGLVVAGTGLLQEQTSANGFSSFRWVERHPTATYLFTYAISDYAVIADEWNGIPMRYYVRRADSTKGAQYFSTVHGMMDALTTAFGPYPFDKVGYCITPIGSMEHQTMISYAEQLFRFESKAGTTAAHELAHMWWGDWVTCEDFGDAWLNEGFAVFAEMVYAEHIGGESGYLDFVRSTSQSYRTSVVPSEGMLPLHDFPRTPPSSNYPSTIYRKGGMVLAMLRDVMGDQPFFDGMKEYGRRHAYANASTEMFQSVMEEFHGSGLDWFFDEWVFKPGYPVYQVQRVVDATGAALRIRLTQTHDTLLYPLYAMPMDLAIIRTTGDTLRRRIDSRATGYEEFTFTDVPANTVQGVVLDPRGIVLKRVSYRTVGVEDALNAAPSSIRIDAVYPNPVSGEMAVRISASRQSALQLSLYDSLGRLALRLSSSATIGDQTLRLNTSALPGGAYTLVAASASGTAVTRILVQ